MQEREREERGIGGIVLNIVEIGLSELFICLDMSWVGLRFD